jgi:DNA modification methylase
MAEEPVITEEYAIYNADCMEVLASLANDSIHLSIYSPPFCGMYQYSSDPADLSNSSGYDEFFEHYEFIIKEKHRVTMPGRISAVHCTDIFQSTGERHRIKDFPGDIIRSHEKYGWELVARIHIWKEPLTVRNRTMVSSLHHASLVEDSTLVSFANADYLLVFRKEGKNPIPVSHPTGLVTYAGAGKGENMTEPADGIPLEVMEFKGYKGDQIKNAYSQWIWRQYASSNWYDIRIDRTLGKGAGIYSGNKADKDEVDEKHMHPLQLDVIERAVILWSNPGEVVLTPFLGIGSEAYGAIINGRRAIGAELKPCYFRQAVQCLSERESAVPEEQPKEALPSLFDGLNDE